MVLIIFYFVLIAQIGAKVEIENKLPKMSLKMLNGKPTDVLSFLEDGPILINFWATWCAPCIKEMKYLDKFNKKYAESGLQIVSINTDTPRSLSKVKSFVKSRGYSFNILLDPKSEYIRKAGGKVLPYLLLVNTDGTIFKR
ncbi:MAG: TlpA family protein disulfide reductase, partial [Candidatus Marinimicrobia bacterium]|nr:TlpA family protein disulfide reductase [Candidatus Neomarinimicrobiota bacterium]